MQQVKGSVLKSRIAYVEAQGGAEAVERVLSTLSDEDRTALQIILTVQWYPFDLGKRLDDAIVAALGEGKPEYFLKLGEASATKNLTSIHKQFLTPGDPHAFLAKAPTIYGLYYETGSREYQKVGEKEGVLITHDAETFSGPDCLTVIGWHRKALEMVGVTGVKIDEEECRARGGAGCRYRVRWA